MAASGSRWLAIARTAAARSFVAVSILYVALGVAWTGLNLGRDVPYGDSKKYEYFAETLTVDRFHGALYPLILRLVNPWDGHLVPLQLIQLCVLMLSIAYFVYALRGADFAREIYGKSGAVWAFALLVLLLLFDPLLAHFSLSLMQDSLALSGCLLFSASLVVLMREGAQRRTATALLFVGFVIAAGVRVEKSWVLLATVFASLPAWFWAAREFRFAPRAQLIERGCVVLGIVLVGSACVQSLQTAMYRDPPPTGAFRFGQWPKLTTVLHHRIVYPNLTSVYDRLSSESRAMLTRRDAEIYDLRIHNTWRVIDRVTRRDAKVRDHLTRDLALNAMAYRWGSISLDVASDTAENVLAPWSFYARLAAWSVTGADQSALSQRFETTPWTYVVLASHYPQVSRFYIALAGALFFFACCLSLLNALDSLRDKSRRPTWLSLFSLAPVVFLCIANAFAFSLSADLVHPRYTIFAHTAVLLLVYRGALVWMVRTRRNE